MRSVFWKNSKQCKGKSMKNIISLLTSWRTLANISGLVLIAAMYCLVQTCEYNEMLYRENAELRKSVEYLMENPKVIHKVIHVQSPEKTSDEPTGNAIAIRNKNPLNIKSFNKKDPWRGQVGVDKHDHAIFESWEYGIRAASLTLRSYARRHKIDTIEGLVMRFAHGNQKPYISYLCRRLDVKPDQEIDLITYMPKLLRHMARFESGQELPERWFAPYDVLAKL